MFGGGFFFPVASLSSPDGVNTPFSEGDAVCLPHAPEILKPQGSQRVPWQTAHGYHRDLSRTRVSPSRAFAQTGEKCPLESGTILGGGRGAAGGTAW